MQGISYTKFEDLFISYMVMYKLGKGGNVIFENFPLLYGFPKFAVGIDIQCIQYIYYILMR